MSTAPGRGQARTAAGSEGSRENGPDGNGRSFHSYFTIVGGTTVPERAAIVREHCREGSPVELRREQPPTEPSRGIGVWLQCPMLFGLVPVWKKIGYLPEDFAQSLPPAADASKALVARGRVCTIYAPVNRDEAVVSVEIPPGA
jgi:hypothetical protein